MISVSRKIFESLQAEKEEPRAHLGASVIGHSCDRWLWFSFRWAALPDHDGRLRRLFRRGNLEESNVVADLRRIGVVVQDKDPKTGVQFQFADGHFAGSLDGVILSGLPDDPGRPHVLEIKTHSRSSFNTLVKNGVKKSKPMHFAQMQIYMQRMGLDRALYFSVCKDDDDIYCEVVEFDKQVADKLSDRAQKIIASDRAPEPVSHDPSWWECKFCPANGMCHGKRWTSEVNCRTCAHSTARRDGTFFCERWQSVIPHKGQMEGCDDHLLHPDMVPWQAKLNDKDEGVSWMINGVAVLNGTGGYKSREIVANPSACAKPDETIDAFRKMGAEVIG